MWRILLAIALGLAACRPAPAFDYWVLALSWSPQYCAGSERASREPQCTRPYAFVVHGLWPQYERGYPKACAQTGPVPQDIVRRMLPIMPSPSLIQHEWRQHGTCSGLAPDAYFAATERAYRKLVIPPAYHAPQDFLRTTAQELERRFVSSNPGLEPAGIAVQCSGRYLREIRVCLDRDFRPRACGVDVSDRCGREAVLRPTR